MVKFVQKNVAVQVVEIKNNLKEIPLFKRKKMSHVTAKKVNVLKNIVNVMLMVSSVAKVAIVRNVRTTDLIIYILLLCDQHSINKFIKKIFNLNNYKNKVKMLCVKNQK